MNKIIVVVEGGNVVNVYSNYSEDLCCEILDYDNGKVDSETDKYNDRIIKEMNNDKNYKIIY